MRNRADRKRSINNLPLSTKIVGIVLLVVCLTVSSSILGIFISQNANNKLLYQALAGSLAYSEKDLSRKLANIEYMTSSIVSNADIKKNLITLAEDETEIRTRNAENSLTNLLSDYYQTYKTNNIYYIDLYYPGGSVTSYEAGSTGTPDEVHQSVITSAEENSGYPYWNTAYCNSYGLFLSRDCRRVNQRNYDTLGTLVVCVDIDKLINSSTNSILHSSETKYVLYDGDSSFYHSSGLESGQIADVKEKLTSDYTVITVDSNKYFAVRGNILNSSWNYICLVPYNGIAHTLDITILLVIAIILVSVCISLLLSRMMIASITKDFKRLVDKMKAFAEDETFIPSPDYSYAVRKDEIGMLHNHFDQMAVKLQHLIQENYINEILTKDAKLKALENQINPHFLYNTLESVNWRAKAIGEKDISAMVESLGALLRGTLNSKEEDFTVSRELEIVDSYLTIQQIRFEDRLRCSQDIDPAILELRLPPLTIQPLVENAIQYSMEELTETCHIQIEGRLEENNIYISVINNGSQFEADILQQLENNQITPHGFGIGLVNIHKRIQMIYGKEHGLILFNEDDDHAVARIVIPGGKL